MFSKISLVLQKKSAKNEAYVFLALLSIFNEFRANPHKFWTQKSKWTLLAIDRSLNRNLERRLMFNYKAVQTMLDQQIMALMQSFARCGDEKLSTILQNVSRSNVQHSGRLASACMCICVYRAYHL